MSDRSRSLSPITSYPSSRVAALRRHARVLMRTCRSTVAAGLCLVVMVTPAFAQPVCKPAISIKKTHLSEVRSHKRIWTAVLWVDAAGCATKSGRFEIGFTRTIEFGPDLDFTEPFVWTPGEITVQLEFAEHEWVLDYWLQDAAACPCQTAQPR